LPNALEIVNVYYPDISIHNSDKPEIMEYCRPFLLVSSFV